MFGRKERKIERMKKLKGKKIRVIEKKMSFLLYYLVSKMKEKYKNSEITT